MMKGKESLTMQEAHPHIPGIEFQKYHWWYTATAATTIVGARVEGRTGGGDRVRAILGI